MVADAYQTVFGNRVLFAALPPGFKKGANLGDANATIQYGEGALRELLASVLTAPRQVTLGTTGAFVNAVITILVRAQLHDVTVTNGGAGGGSTVLSSGNDCWADFRYDGTDWKCIRFARADASEGIAASLLPTTIIINGQSNAVAGPPAPIRGASAMTKHLGADILGFSQATQTFVQAVDGGASSKTTVAVPSSTTGPGVGQVGALLARRIATRTGQTVRTYALAYTAQGVDYFLPNSATLAFFDDNTQHGSLNNYNLLKSYKDASGIVPQLYVWIQGEANAGMTQADYYSKLKTIFDQSRIDYPGIRWIVVSTVGNKQGRNSPSAGVLAGVNAAKRQLAEENPGVVFYVDITDFAETAYMMPDDTHLATYCGYEELAERCFVALTGEAARPKVSSSMHVRDALAWSDFYYVNRTIAAGDVSQWQTDIPPNTNVMVPHNAKAPLHVAFDSIAGYRSAIEFDRDNSETLKKTALAAANDWTFFMVFKGQLINAQQFLLTVQDAGSGNRAGAIWAGNANQHQAFYDPVGSQNYVGSPGWGSDAIAVHSLCWVLDTTNLLITAYIDGIVFGTLTISGSEVNMTEAWVGSILGTSAFEGRVFAFAYARNVIATAQNAADMHAWAREEFKLAA